MRPDQLGGKTVIDTGAQVIGDVCGIEFEITAWNVTHICVNLSDTAIEALGYQKPRFLGKVIVDIPVEFVKAVSDMVALDRRVNELKSIIELH